jgi:hypothetical protein
MIRALVLSAAALSFSACVDTFEVGEAEQAIMSCSIDPDAYNCKCTGCGANGLEQSGWNAMFAEADRTALSNYGAWSWGSDAPVSLCDPGTVIGSSCTLRPSWSAWIAGNPAKRVGMMENMVKVVAQKTYAVRDPNGYTYYGEFGLAAGALASSWSYADQEIVTGGILALLNSVHGVPVCLKTERHPDNCAGSDAVYHESVTFGKTFRGHYAAISGGYHAKDPSLNLRYGTVDGGSASAFRWSDGKCATYVSGVNTIATGCTDQYGTWWNWPVTVLVPTAPSTWYYNVGGSELTRPGGTPIVY